MISQGKRPLQLQILHQATLPELNPLAYYKLLHMRYQHNNLPQFLFLTQMSTLIVDISQSWLLYSHLIWHQKNLPHLFFLNQMSTIPVDIPQAFYIYSHLRSHWRRLSQLHHLHQVTLPVETPPQSHQIKHQRNPLTLSPPNNSSQVFHHHPLLRIHQWDLFWILLLWNIHKPL